MINQTIQLYKDAFGGLSKEVWLLAAVMFINRTGTMVITFLMIYLTTELDFSLTRAGMVMSCFGIGSLLGSYIGGWLTDKIGYYWVIFGSLFFGGFSFFFLIPLESFWAWCVGIVVVSTIGDSFRPANMAAIGIYSSEENRTRSISLARIAFNMGLTFGPAIGGIIAMNWGYDYLFVLDGMTCMLAGIAFTFLLPKKEANAKQTELSTQELSTAPSLSAYKNTFFIKFVLCIFLGMITFMHLFSVLTTYWKTEMGLSEQEVGFLFAANGFIIALFEMPMIYLLEKKYKVFTLIIAGGTVIGLGFILYPFIGFWMGSVLISMLLITLGEIINFPFLNTVSLSVAPPDRRGEYMGLYGISFSASLIIAPTFGGKVAELWGYDVLWIILGVFSLVSVLGFYVLRGEYDEILLAQKEW